MRRRHGIYQLTVCTENIEGAIVVECQRVLAGMDFIGNRPNALRRLENHIVLYRLGNKIKYQIHPIENIRVGNPGSKPLR